LSAFFVKTIDLIFSLPHSSVSISAVFSPVGVLTSLLFMSVDPSHDVYGRLDPAKFALT
jgi:hypothetical protein